jgi:uncharacterized protein
MESLSSRAKFYAARFYPHEDLKKSIEAFATAHCIGAGFVAGCVGSLEQINLRYADAKAGTIVEGKFEIISLVGTLGTDGVHLHMSVADGHGVVKAGHLLDANVVYTTVEIVIGHLSDLSFTRVPDETYGYRELVIKPKEMP